MKNITLINRILTFIYFEKLLQDRKAFMTCSICSIKSFPLMATFTTLLWSITFSYIMLDNGQTLFKNLVWIPQNFKNMFGYFSTLCMKRSKHMAMKTITAMMHYGQYKLYWYKDLLTIYSNRIEFRVPKIFSAIIRKKYFHYTWQFNYWIYYAPST